MANAYSWSHSRDRGGYRLPGPDRLGWWAAVAMLLSVLLHVIVFFALDHMKIAFHFSQSEDLATNSIDIRQSQYDPVPAETSLPPEETITPPADSAALMDEIDLLDVLPPDQEIDLKTDIKEAEYALQMRNPAREGDPSALAMDISSSIDLASDLPEFGREPVSIQPAEVGQMTVDPGAISLDESELGKYTDSLLRRGANGNVADGKLDGVTSLDTLLDLPPNLLLGKKTMLPSDLLFEFNSSELRESAKLGLMKLVLLMDKNPQLYCWIEGHTDLVGGDRFNLDLSIRRAQAVKDYLVKSAHVDAGKIITRGFGRYQPLITTGSADQQAANRRVEVRMRKTPPEEAQMSVEPEKAAVIEEAPPPKAILVKPNRALPVEIVPLEPEIPQEPDAPKARPVPEIQEPEADFPEVPIPRATPVDPPRALAVPEEEIPRARAVE